jgi:hypothetical protein
LEFAPVVANVTAASFDADLLSVEFNPLNLQAINRQVNHPWMLKGRLYVVTVKHPEIPRDPLPHTLLSQWFLAPAKVYRVLFKTTAHGVNMHMYLPIPLFFPNVQAAWLFS